MCSVWCAVVVEQLVVCADLFVYLVHVILYDARDSVIVWVTSFSCLEEDIRVLSCTSKYRMLRVKSSLSKLLHLLEVYHISYVFHIPCLDLLDLVRCSESVKEVDEWYSALDS